MNTLQTTCPICNANISIKNHGIEHVCPNCEMTIFIDTELIMDKHNAIEREKLKQLKIATIIQETGDNDFNYRVEMINSHRLNEDFEKSIKLADKLAAKYPNNAKALGLLAISKSENIIHLINNNKPYAKNKITEIISDFDKALKAIAKEDEIYEELKYTQLNFSKTVLLNEQKKELEKVTNYTKKVENADLKAKPTATKSKPTKSTDNKDSLDLIYESPEPRPFLGNKFSKICLYSLLTLIALMVFGIFKTKNLERTYAIYCSILFTSILLIWIIVYLVKRFKKIDTTEPKPLKIIRKIVNTALLIFSVYTTFIGLTLLIYEFYPEFISALKDVSGNSIAYEYMKLKILLLATGALLIIRITIFSINQIRIQNYLYTKKPKKQKDNKELKYNHMPTSKKEQLSLLEKCHLKTQSINNEIEKLNNDNSNNVFELLKEKFK